MRKHFIAVKVSNVGASSLVMAIKPEHVAANFDVLLTVHLSIFISVINQHDV